MRARSLHAAVAAAGLAAALATAPAFAARPMITDDARIVDARACQVESWLRLNRSDRHQFWAVPGCNPTGNLELSAGGSIERLGGETRLSNALVQAKTLFKPLQTNGWGIGLAVGRSHERALQPDDAGPVSHYAYVPMSLSLRDDAVVTHLNLGLRTDRQNRHTFATLGLGAEIQLRDRLQLIAETFGESRSRPFVHGGLRLWVVPDRVQVDTTYGTELRSGTGNRWVSFGVRLLSPAFLP